MIRVFFTWPIICRIKNMKSNAESGQLVNVGITNIFFIGKTKNHDKNKLVDINIKT